MAQAVNLSQLFTSKLNTLLFLKDKLSASCVLDSYFFSVHEFNENPDAVFFNISKIFDGEVIIRSSSSTEDSYSTNAGHFLSAQHIDSQNKEAVFGGINAVSNSYLRDNLTDSEVMFVQKQLTNAAFSGVALSYEPTVGKPYYLVNYDGSGKTDSVTSGKCNQYMYIARDYLWADAIESKLCRALLEVEQACNDSSLNVEFAVSNSGKIIIFQVRRLRTLPLPVCQEEILKNKSLYASNYLKKIQLLSDMAFWNPSEMIGEAPRPLDYSLYDYLVTESAWNDGIKNVGYSAVKSNLMTQIGNKPYIDLIASFAALTPSEVGNVLRQKLVDYYCAVLMRDTGLHDKIEFEVVFNCFNFSTAKKLNSLKAHGFDCNEVSALSNALFKMTKALIENYQTFLEEDLCKLDFLENSLNRCKIEYPLNSTESIIASIKELLPIVRDYGVVPFARQARCAFVARSLCISLVEENLINADSIDSFMRSVDTVAQNLKVDAELLRRGNLSSHEFLIKYGHLRSNTYDITSKSYNELKIDEIISAQGGVSRLPCEADFTLESICFPHSQVEISDFIKKSIARREHFKFVFTKALSYILDSIVMLSQQVGVSREDIAYLALDEIYGLISKDAENRDLHEVICKNKHRYNVDSLLALPSVISNVDDFEIIRVTKSSPNFVTSKCVEGSIIVFENSSNHNIDINGKIVAIQNADPGFDWIFAKGTIGGLITKYGGAASHMAIRCMEFGIPAAIGCGELIYNQVMQGARITLDCKNKEVLVK